MVELRSEGVTVKTPGILQFIMMWAPYLNLFSLKTKIKECVKLQFIVRSIYLVFVPFLTQSS